jgi:glutaredoxin
MTTELVIVLTLAGACMLVGLASSILYIVAGFRTGVGWGIANLLPLGSLVFTICRWDAAKRPFLLSLVSALLAFGTFTAAGGRLNQGMPTTAALFEQFAQSIGSLKSFEANVDPAEDLVRLRDQEVLLEEQISSKTAELKVAYADLLAKRNALAPGDKEGLWKFNQEAAAYSEQSRQLSENRAELKRLRQSIHETVNQRSGGGVGGGGTAESAPQITIYSTSWCNPCKMAKAHLKKRGVAFREIDVEKSPEGAREFQKLGGGGVPLIVINGEKIRGFDAQRIDALLDRG